MVGRPFKVTVTESLEELEKAVRHARTASQKERLTMLVCIKREEVRSRAELAHRINRDKATITRWIRATKMGGCPGY